MLQSALGAVFTLPAEPWRTPKKVLYVVLYITRKGKNPAFVTARNSLGADIMCHWEGGAYDIHGKIGFKRGLFLHPAWWPATRRRRRRQLFSPVP